ncbi:alpha/beta hydrolase [Sorangium sp. So ce1389]|uniref:alpha/beta hydrolase n=1 Tax=Sorangium sp. So ce1389 TaxID=3133336 RepID=UPI003F634DCE
MRTSHSGTGRGLLVRSIVRLSVAPCVALAVIGCASQPLDTSADAALRWQPCGQDGAQQCALLDVPVDWADPQGDTITLSISRHLAADPASRVGALFFTPGPGVDVAAMVASPGVGFLGAAAPGLLRSFDIVGVTPRGGGLLLGEEQPGVAQGTLLRCDAPAHDTEVSLFPQTQAAYEALVASNRAYAEGCLAHGKLLAHMDAASHARDMEAVRAALGEDTVSWVAWTYFDRVALTYAALYPEHIRAMAVDGPLDGSQSMRQMVSAQAAAVELELRRFAAWCDDAETEGCALEGEDVAEAYAAVLEQLDQQPVPLPGGHGWIRGQEAAFMLMNGLEVGPIEFFGWGVYASAVQQARQGNTETLASLYAYTWGDSFYGPYRAATCLDLSPQVPGHEEMMARIDAVTEIAPLTRGATEAWEAMSACLGWPVAPVDPHASPSVRGTPPILVIGSRYNPYAPYEGVVAVAHQIEQSALLTHDGDGHIAFTASPCVVDHVQRYLLSATPPPPGAECPAGPE